MAKTKKKSTRSVNSSNTKSSASTKRASNMSASSSSEISEKSIKKPKSSKQKKKKPKLPPPVSEIPRTPEPDPLRTRSQSEPVDLDRVADSMSHEMGEISPAETFDTVPLSAGSMSFDSRNSSSYHKRGHNRNQQLNSHGDDRSIHSGNDYLPVSLLNFNSPRNGNGNGSNGNGNQNKVVIEHKIKDKGGGRSRSTFGGSSMLCLIKPLLLFLFLATLVAGAASVYGWLFKFPDLNKQVAALEEQVFRLNGEVDRLEIENNRYQRLNDRLNITVDDLEDVRDDLNGTVSELEDVASVLNTTKDQIVAEIQELQDQNIEYAQLNAGLQSNVMELAGEVEFFREALEELSDEHSILKNTTNSLQDLANRFSNTTIDQKETLTVLKETLEGFQAENDRLEDFNKNLETALNYLNETLFANGNLVESSTATLVQITEVLGERVQQQQRSTLTQLEISYRQLLAGWDCDYRDVFRSEPYGQNYDTLLPPPSAGSGLATSGVLIPTEVETYIDQRVLSKMCLDLDDFRKFLSSVVGEGITSNELIRAVVLYTDAAMEYYFPSNVNFGNSNNANGITLSEWIDAGFRCNLLESPFEENWDSINGINVRRQRSFNLRHRR